MWWLRSEKKKRKKKQTCDIAEHGSAAFMSQPLSNLGGGGERKAEKV